MIKPLWMAEKILNDGKVPVLPCSRYKGRKDGYRPWDYKYAPVKDVVICPHGETLRHTTTDRDGKRIYRSIPQNCVNGSSTICRRGHDMCSRRQMVRNHWELDFSRVNENCISMEETGSSKTARMM